MYISFFKKSEVFIFCNMWIFRTIPLFYNNFIEQDLVNFSVKNKIVQESKPENEQISTILELLLINVLAPQGEKWYSQSKNFIIKGIRKVFFFLNESHYIFFFYFIMVGYLLQEMQHVLRPRKCNIQNYPKDRFL